MTGRLHRAPPVVTSPGSPRGPGADFQMARPHADQLSMLHPHPRPPSAGDSPGAAVLPHSGAGVSRERQPPERESRSLRLPEAGTWSQHSVIPATPFRSNGHSPESLGEAERGGAGLPSAVTARRGRPQRRGHTCSSCRPRAPPRPPVPSSPTPSAPLRALTAEAHVDFLSPASRIPG